MRRAINTHDRATARIAAADLGVMFMGTTLLTPLYVLYQDAFRFSSATLTLIYATYGVGNLVALFLFGHISDQLGRKRIALAATALAATATLMFLFAPSIAWLFVGRAMSGVAIGLAAGAATAWIADAAAHGVKGRASIDATAANFLGLAVGALVAGVLAQYGPAPLRLSHVVYLVLLTVLVWLLARTHDSSATATRVGACRRALFAPIGVPSAIRARFMSPATNAFTTFALLGFYAALAPTMLREDLGVANVAAAGAVVTTLFAIAAAAVHATARLPSRSAMLGGLALLLPSVSLLVLAHALRSLPLLVTGAAITGLAVALGYRGSLQVVNDIAPAAKRAEVISSYQIACFAGNALPVVAVGILAEQFGAKLAIGTLAIVVAGLAALALILELSRADARSRRALLMRR
jgi:MFS family permease